MLKFHIGKNKLTAFMLAVIISSTFSSCSSIAQKDDAANTVKSMTSSNQTKNEKAVSLTSISLAYDPTDSLNPFKARTLVNYNLMPVIYDSLFKLDNKFLAQKELVTAYNNQGLIFVVLIKDNVKFSDGSILTANDVVYSINQAKSSLLYKKQLSNVKNVYSQGKKVVFELKREDRLFANCLDVPIVKDGTAKNKNDFPIGCGRYKFKDKTGKISLVYNENWHKNKKPKFKTITLETTPDEEAIITSVKTGTVALMFSDLSDGEIGGIGASTQSLSLNNMVYLGINSKKGVLKQAKFRQAISYAIDQNNVLSKGYLGRGAACYLPYNPAYDIGETLTDKDYIAYSTQQANKILDELEYDKKDKDGYRLDKDKRIELNLLINKQNNYKKLTSTALVAMLREVGIKLNVVAEEDFNTYKSKVRNLRFDLYLGETKLLNNMDITGFFTNSELSSGISNKTELLSIYKSYQNKSKNYSFFAKKFYEQTPFVPLVFRSGIIAYNNNFKVKIISTPSDIFYNIIDWK